MFLSQDVVISNINKYLAVKNKRNGSHRVYNSYTIDQGLCSGLVAYWLYLMRTDEEGFFLHRLQYLTNWGEDAFVRSGKQRDEIIEQFLDNVLLLHEPNKVIGTAKQSDLDISFGLALGGTQEQIGAPEFSLSFIFNKAEIQKLIPSIASPNKMVRLGSGLHVLGLMNKNNAYTLYDPNSKEGPIESTDLKYLSDTIFTGFSTYCKSKDYIAMNISVYDLVGAEPASYFDPIQYCSNQMKDRTVKQAALQHKFLFFVLASYNEYQTMDLLFANGYEYIPWKHHVRTEMNEAVLHGDVKKLKYLIDHHLPVDPKSLPIAIQQKSSEMMYLLLAAGAVSNVNSRDQKSYLDLALEQNFPEAIVLLLASGMDINAGGKVAIQHKFAIDGMKVIFNEALLLQKSFLKIPSCIELNDATGEILGDYAKHFKLASQLGLTIVGTDVLKDDKVIAPKEVMANILQIFNQHPLDDTLSVSEKSELENILLYFYPDIRHNKNYAKDKLSELNKAAIQIATQLSQVDTNTISKSDIADAQLVLENICLLAFETDTGQGNKDSEKAQKKIDSYLESHHIQKNFPRSNYIFFSLNVAKHPSAINYDRDVEVLLQECRSLLFKQ